MLGYIRGPSRNEGQVCIRCEAFQTTFLDLRLMAHQIVHAYWDSALMGHVDEAPSRTFAAAHRAHVGFRAPGLLVVARNVAQRS